MSKQKTIYDLELFQKTDIDNHTRYERVPGGWIVSKYITRGVALADMSTTFVPYNNEFKNPIKFDVPKYRKEEIKVAIRCLEGYIEHFDETHTDDEDIDFLHFKMKQKEVINQLKTALSILKSNTK